MAFCRCFESRKTDLREISMMGSEMRCPQAASGSSRMQARIKELSELEERGNWYRNSLESSATKIPHQCGRRAAPSTSNTKPETKASTNQWKLENKFGIGSTFYATQDELSDLRKEKWRSH
jgi:hypothetical protein